MFLLIGINPNASDTSRMCALFMWRMQNTGVWRTVTVAVKIIPTSWDAQGKPKGQPGARRSFDRGTMEGLLCKELRHPHVVQVRNAFEILRLSAWAIALALIHACSFPWTHTMSP